MKHVKITIYLHEDDKWQHRPLHLELLSVLDQLEIAGGTVLRAIAGFTYHHPVETSSLVDVGSKLPLVVQFIDTVAKIESVLPTVLSMVGSRLVIREPVQVLNGI
ncbi:DUF190 domain-containing protein [Legionella drancourtii]|uniref:Uncharacterized protein n=1 Tax=Legionella drancourtii LLAP12 TaxID=658187 RepID=G9ES17_9GAMM|nr:DUF190 domain-containing protein [Legionella drancourtii]EHL29798.1 hypothetical protein LDG_8089 [Legionella drancourtii LLAP12]